MLGDGGVVAESDRSSQRRIDAAEHREVVSGGGFACEPGGERHP